MIKKIITSLILSIILVATVQAAMGIPDTYKPKNIPLQGLNETITKTVTADSQDGAVTGVNIVLQYMANLLLFFAAPLSVLFLARAGADYAFAMGEDSKLESAKRELTWSLVGLVLIMFAYVIIRVAIQPLLGLQSATDAALEAQCQATYKMSCAEANKTKIDSTTQKALDKPLGSDFGKVDGVTAPSLTGPDQSTNPVDNLKLDSGEKSSLNTPFITDPSLSKPIMDPLTGKPLF